MRLTVGGMLILVGLGAAGGFVAADKGNLELVVSKAKDLVGQAGSLVGLVKTEEQKPEVYSPPPPFPNGVAEGAVTSSTETVLPDNSSLTSSTTSTLPLDTTPILAQPVVEATPVIAAKPVVKKTVRRSRRSRKKPVAVKAPVAAKTKTISKKTAKPTVKSPAKPAAATMLGSYVSLELITGRSVQGILDAKTATHYVLNVPGLGPLEYPIENVKNVLPAQ